MSSSEHDEVLFFLPINSKERKTMSSQNPVKDKLNTIRRYNRRIIPSINYQTKFWNTRVYKPLLQFSDNTGRNKAKLRVLTTTKSSILQAQSVRGS